MKTRVNFYFDEFQPKTFLINPSFTALLWSIAIIVIVVGAIQANSILDNAKVQVDQVNQSISDKRKVITMLTNARNNLEQDPALLADIERYQNEYQIKRSIVTELDSRQGQKSTGYAQLMLDLARIHQQGIWLTQIHLNEDDVRLQGGASDSAAVPKWVNKLNQANYFEGAQFAEARMYRDEEEQLFFTLSSQRQNPSSEQGDDK